MANAKETATKNRHEHEFMQVSVAGSEQWLILVCVYCREVHKMDISALPSEPITEVLP